MRKSVALPQEVYDLLAEINKLDRAATAGPRGGNEEFITLAQTIERALKHYHKKARDNAEMNQLRHAKARAMRLRKENGLKPAPKKYASRWMR